MVLWLSPFGGYEGNPKQRPALGKQQGLEMGAGRLRGLEPKYSARFRQLARPHRGARCASFFKFDGLARSLDETEAMLAPQPRVPRTPAGLFLDLTTGASPSPFWLWYGDSTSAAGDKTWVLRAPDQSQQWVTYRDLVTYYNVVRAAPLYPINSLMTQGVVLGKFTTAAPLEATRRKSARKCDRFSPAARACRLYISPEMLTPENWDDLAACASWSAKNADVLVDVHWIGGDLGRAKSMAGPRGRRARASWRVRNPTPQRATIAIDIGRAFELPPGAGRSTS